MGTARSTAEDRNFYLKTVMAYRKVTAEKLSGMTRISKRTIERYMSGRTDIAEAAGLTVAKISYVLSADAYVLGGVSPVSMDILKKPAGSGQPYPRYEEPYKDFGASDALKWAMNYRGYDTERLSAETGIKVRTISAFMRNRADIRNAKASTVFPLCRKLVFPPDFLYGLRRMDQYNDYLDGYEARQKELAQAKKVLAKARQIMKEESDERAD